MDQRRRETVQRACQRRPSGVDAPSQQAGRGVEREHDGNTTTARCRVSVQPRRSLPLPAAGV